MDMIVLEGAIAALFGVLGAVAKVAWAERGSTIARQDKELSYYREQVMPTMNRVLDASDEQLKGFAVLTRVVEDDLRRRRPSE